jgi:hypothetical protein
MTNLPLDIWFIIIEHLSLADLMSICNAFGSTASDASSITKRHAIKVISTMLATGTVRIVLDFANNGPCYKFHLKNPRAGQYRHRQDHGQIRPCTGECYNPWFPRTMGYTRTFQPNTVDDTHTVMTLFANNGKTFEERCVRKLRRRPNHEGPAEMIVLTADFSLSSLESNNYGALHLEFDTLSEDIDDTFKDTPNSPSHLTRTIAHCIPLRRASWVDFNEQYNALPMDWFEFMGPGISALSTFSKKLIDTSFPDSEEEWQWSILSFETKWSLLLPFIDRSADIQTP